MTLRAAAKPLRAPPGPADVVVVPRYVVYCQGALLAIVALVAFAIGMLMGGTFVSRPKLRMRQLRFGQRHVYVGAAEPGG